MRIGIDFDNTIAGYDHVFRAEARRLGWLPPAFEGGKREVRAALAEEDWMRLQGRVYGPLMQAAELLPGVEDFLWACRAAGHALFIVSHKTRRGHFDESGVNLRDAAREWMTRHGFFTGPGALFEPEDVSFHSTREGKLERIRQLQLDVFVDDLPAVLTDRGFPQGTRALLYGAEAHAPAGIEGCTDWEQVTRRVLGELVPEAHGFDVQPCADAEPQRGGNNRLQRVRRGEQSYALKTFERCASDRRDRLGAERAALEFLGPHLGPLVPRLEAAHGGAGALLCEWVEGQDPGAAGPADVEAMASFLAQLHALRREPGALELPLASEACLSGDELLRQLKERRERLRAVSCIHPELAAFLQGELEPALEQRSAQAREEYVRQGWDLGAELEHGARSLSPSDFGLHNALRRADGTLVFLDFEYFGWDDPAKLVCDTLLHPAMDWSEPLARRFAEAVLETYGGADPGAGPFSARLQALYPLYGCRWACILLNAYLPERQRRLAFAQARQGQEALGLQLDKARTMLRSSQQAPALLRLTKTTP